MTKILSRALFIIILSITTFSTYGQAKLGVQVSPSLSSNRVDSEVDSLSNYSSYNAGVKFTAGLVADFILNENYYFSTGIIYAPKRVGISNGESGSSLREESYKLQYLRLPIDLKLYTNEITLDTRLYFKAGVLLETKIFQESPELDSGEEPMLDRFSLFNLPLELGAGLEYRVGYNTLIYGGFSYQRGLINGLSEDNISDGNDTDLLIKNDMLAIDFGIKF